MDQQQQQAPSSADNASIKVYVRVRPRADGGDPDEIITIPPLPPGAGDPLIAIRDSKRYDGRNEHQFQFDNIFDPGSTQNGVFDEVAKPLINHTLDGFNSCCFAYGQTGSGKTYTIFGEGGDKDGLVPRAVDQLFSSIADRSKFRTFAVFVSFLEIYCDAVRDLGKFSLEEEATPRDVSERSRAQSIKTEDLEEASLEIRENPNGTVFVQDLSVIPVTSTKQVLDIIKTGVQKRKTFGTKMNDVSSRSHTVFNITVVQQDRNDPDADTITGMLNLVDLAGSERIAKSQSSGQRLKEAVNINKSLSALGNVVTALGQGKYVPYRDSKLTRILQDSLGGNSYTTVLATLHSNPEHYEESLNTLQFATRCRMVKNKPTINYMESADVGVYERRIKKLTKEIGGLKEQLASTEKRYETMIRDLQNRLEIVQKRGPEGTTVKSETAHRDPLRMLEMAHENNKFLKGKLDKKMEDFKVLQERVRASQEKHQADLLEAKDKVSALANQVQSGKQDMVNAMNVQLQAHSDELNTLIERNQQLLEEQNSLLRAIPESLRVRSELIRTQDDMRKEGYLEAEEEYRRILKAHDQSKVKEVAAVKEQYEYFLNNKRDELERFVKELNEFKETKEAQVHKYKRELEYVFDYTDKLARLIENIDDGVFPVGVKFGVKHFVIPNSARPGSIDFDVCDYIKRHMNRLDRDIAHLLIGAEDIGGGGASLSDSATDRSTPEEFPEIDGVDLNFNVRRMTRQQMQQTLLDMRVWIMNNQPEIPEDSGEARAKLEEQVLDDLASHPTVEYIRRLEDEKSRYQDLLKDERKRNKELRIALEAKQRLLEKSHTPGFSSSRPATTRTSMTARSYGQL